MDYDVFDNTPIQNEILSKKIAELLKTKPLTKTEIFTQMNISPKTAYVLLKNLRLNGIVRRIRIGKQVFFGLREEYRR